jgi:23S rRNA (guanine745-N1)-methyltransferase
VDRTKPDAWPLACPVCDAELERGLETLACSAGHAFDVAREGYINLLLSQHRVGRIDGDVADMLRARRRFLESGYYRPLYELLVTKVTEVLQDRHPARLDPGRACVFEVGCGEGYYIGSIARELRSAASPKTAFVGMDLSKAATRLAGKRYRDVLFFVADVHRRIYLQSGSVSVLLDVFSPRNPAEFARVLEPGGCVLIVIPSESHLGSLRTKLGLLKIQADKERQVLERFTNDFSLVDRRELRYPLELPAAAAEDLVNMGPNYWHRSGDSVGVGGHPVAIEAAFMVLHLQRKRAAV